MDIPSAAWLVDQEMEDPIEFMINQQTRPAAYNELLVDSLTSQSFKGYQDLLAVTRNPTAPYNNNIHAAAATINQQLQDLNNQEMYNYNYKLPSTNLTATRSSSSSSFAPAVCGTSSNTFTISFGTTSPTTINKNQIYGEYKLDYHHHDLLKYKDDMSLDKLLGSIELPRRAPTTRRNHRQAQEHVLAERKRREKLTQRFISLSSLLPEIKKMDKATVLEDASKYIKQLQNQVKELEETTLINSKGGIESTSSMGRSSKFHYDHEASSFDHHNSFLSCNNTTYDYNPGIKVRISGNNILVRIYCHKNSSLAVKALSEMERLHFTIMCNSVLQISGTAALITIIAQMSEEFVMTAMDLVRCLQSSLSSFL